MDEKPEFLRPILAVTLLLALTRSTLADDTRYVVENGVTYRETRRVAKVPVTSTQLEERTETVYRTENVTELRDEVRSYWVPVSDYVYEPRWHNTWNPFKPATASYQLRPVVRWQLRTETVRVPVTTGVVIPETRIVRQPVRLLGFSEQEYVERVAVSHVPQPAAGTIPGPAHTPPSTVARQPERNPVTTFRLPSSAGVPAPSTGDRR